MIAGGDYQIAAMSLSGELVNSWIQAYEAAVGSANIHLIDRNTFTYVFDFAQEHRWPSRPVCNRDSRTVAVIGFSAKGLEARDDYRLKGWVGGTTRRFGANFDKGHFIAHSIGGRVDRSEMNVFAQRRDLNRGWSTEGREYVAMERYCARHPGVLAFSRPIYGDSTDRPAFVEFGILRQNGSWWIRVFDNRSRLQN